MATLELDITVRHGAFALSTRHALELTGITALFGPSGSGKTTLLRTIAGLERAAQGRVVFDGTVWQDGSRRMPPHRRRIGYVFQDGRLFPHLTVAENLRFALRRAVSDPSRTRIELADAVTALALAPLLDRRPSSLSGGEQQRVAIGRALLTNPRLLLMDEPLSALDVGRKREIIPYIEKLPAAFDVPVLYVTHNVDEVARLASHVVLLNDGRIGAHGTVAEIFERLDLSIYAGGRETGAVLSVQVESADHGIATLRLGQQRLKVPLASARPGERLRLRIHASDVALATERPARLSIRNILGAEVLSIDGDDGIHVDLLLAVDGQHLRSRITRDAHEELALRPGQRVFALIKSVALESTLLG